jgi:hypothetical protein
MKLLLFMVFVHVYIHPFSDMDPDLKPSSYGSGSGKSYGSGSTTLGISFINHKVMSP